MSASKFVWYDLMTTNTDAAVAFYRHVIGWRTQPFDGGKGDYLMWVGDQGPLGGVMVLPDQAAAMGAPPHWMSHVTVDDIDASVAKARALGATIHQGPEAIPTVGRFAVLGDPQGGALSLFQPERQMPLHDTTKHGEFCWSELATTDPDAALRFYAELFGWTLMESMDMGPMGSYLIVGGDGEQLAGIFRKPDEMPAVAWLYYAHVDDLDAAIARGVDRGAKLVSGPMEIPGNARVAQLLDPQGAMFALHGA